MSQLIAHLVGDYVLQSHTMAIKKTSSWKWALIHAAFYGIPFLFLVTNPLQWLIIVLTHALIDRHRIADKWCRFYGVGHPGLWWTDADWEAHHLSAARKLHDSWADRKGWIPWVPGGDSFAQDEAQDEAMRSLRYEALRLTVGDAFPAPPPYIGAWLTIIVDNTAHLAINYLMLR